MSAVKVLNHFAQNRPVHLARRDVYFERAAAMISGRLRDGGAEESIREYEALLSLLRTARMHARFSIRETGRNGKDEQFCRFVSLLAGNVKAVLSMMNLRHLVETEEGSFIAFLGANHASVALLAEEYQRRANDIVRSIHNTLRLAGEPFEQLKRENEAGATAKEMERYRKARDHFELLLRDGVHPGGVPPAPPGCACRINRG